MALSRTRRESNLIWPGFVDAVTTLLMVLMFVLTIFTLMQSVLRDQITTQGNELTALNKPGCRAVAGAGPGTPQGL
jgi:chemotaxis protein MotB